MTVAIYMDCLDCGGEAEDFNLVEINTLSGEQECQTCKTLTVIPATELLEILKGLEG